MNQKKQLISVFILIICRKREVCSLDQNAYARSGTRIYQRKPRKPRKIVNIGTPEYRSTGVAGTCNGTGGGRDDLVSWRLGWSS